MHILEPAIEAYLKGLVPAPDPVRSRMEELAAQRDFPIIGPIVGQLVSVMARCIGARRVFEMGSGFGYSTLWFSGAVGPGGQVVHTEGSADNSKLARGFLGEAGLAGRVRFEVGDAREILEQDLQRGSGGSWDVVFNDMDKEQYPDVLPLARRALRPGGLLICDTCCGSGGCWRRRRPTTPRAASSS
jgi:predicted O-methyltransferase YrrM